ILPGASTMAGTEAGRDKIWGKPEDGGPPWPDRAVNVRVGRRGVLRRSPAPIAPDRARNRCSPPLLIGQLPRRGSRLPYGGALTGWMHSPSSRPDREQRRAAAVPGENAGTLQTAPEPNAR